MLISHARQLYDTNDQTFLAEASLPVFWRTSRWAAIETVFPEITGDPSAPIQEARQIPRPEGGAVSSTASSRLDRAVFISGTLGLISLQAVASDDPSLF